MKEILKKILYELFPSFERTFPGYENKKETDPDILIVKLYLDGLINQDEYNLIEYKTNSSTKLHVSWFIIYIYYWICIIWSILDDRWNILIFWHKCDQKSRWYREKTVPRQRRRGESEEVFRVFS